MKKVNVGMIGFGLSGSVFHAPFIYNLEGFNLKAIVSSRTEVISKRYPQTDIYTTPEALFSDPEIDLIIICTPLAQHFPLAKAALEHNKHVVVEKPFVLTAAEGKALIDLAKQKNCLLSVYQNRRWDNDFLALQACLKKGLLGTIYSCELRFDRFRPIVASEKWREQPLPGSGSLYDLGSHLIDQALCLFGWPEAIYADLATQRPAALTPDYFHILLYYRSLRVVLHAGALVKSPGPRFLIHGTQGSFIKYGIDPQEQVGLHAINGVPFDKGDSNEIKTVFEVEGVTFEGKVDLPKGDYAEYYRQLYAALVKGAALPVPAEEALNNIKLIEYAVQSNKMGQKIIL